MYTAQINSFGNVIVCKGNVVRNSYRIMFTGSYQDCLKAKVANVKLQKMGAQQ
jgi:hypothetical protein